MHKEEKIVFVAPGRHFPVPRKNMIAIGLRRDHRPRSEGQVVYHPYSTDTRHSEDFLEPLELYLGNFPENIGHEIFFQDERHTEMVETHQHPGKSEDLAR